jgi:hypothetical protein
LWYWAWPVLLEASMIERIEMREVSRATNQPPAGLLLRFSLAARSWNRTET